MYDISDARLLDTLYSVAVEPERYRELAAVWQHYLDQLEDEAPDGIRLDASHLLNHFDRAASLADATAIKTLDARPSIHDRLDREIQPMIAVNEDLKVVASNGPAKLSFPIEDGKGLDCLPFSAKEVQAIKNEITAKFADKQVTEDASPVILRAKNLNSGTSVLLLVNIWEGFAGRRLVLIKTTEFVWQEKLTPAISKAFGLTAAEADIVKLIVEGASVTEVAETRGSKISTVRAQIRSLYAKTGTANQSEFMRMAVGLTVLQLFGSRADPAPVEVEPVDGFGPFPRPENLNVMRLSDGRVMEFARFGAENGKPIVYFHNDLTGNVWPVKIVEMAALAGLTIIVPSRPFYGNSDPYPEGVNYPEQHADDVVEVLDFLEIDSVMLCSQTIGGAFGLVFADRHPTRVKGFFCLSPLLPHASRETETRMPLMHRFISSVVNRSPYFLDFVARAGMAYYQRVGPLRFLQHAFGDLECDLPILNDPDHQRALIQGLAFGSNHGHKGFVSGHKFPVYDALDRIKRLQFPIQLMIGDSDENTRLERAKALEAHGVEVEIITAKNGGELLIYSHPRQVIDELCKAMAKAGF